MALSIVNNIASLTAQDNLSRTSSALSQSLERLSSGLKINRGADGPAGLVISEQQRAEISGIQTAINNTTKGVSVVQTGEGALNEISSLLVQIRGLAVDSANSGVNDVNSLNANQAQIANALTTINQIATSTEFGTKKLLDGSQANVTATSGAANVSNLSSTGSTVNGNYTVTISQQGKASVFTGSNGFTGAGGTLANNALLAITDSNGTTKQIATGTNQTVNDVANAINNAGLALTASVTGGQLKLTSQRFGGASDISVALVNGTDDTGLTGLNGTVAQAKQALQAKINGNAAITAGGALGNVITATSGNENGLSFTVAANSANTTQTTATGATLSVGAGLTFQIGQDAGETASIGIQRVAADNLGVNVSGLNNITTSNLGLINVTTANGSQDAIAVVAQAITDVSSLRGRLGAFQANTLQATADNLRTTLENTTAGESNIRDTDFAAETANFTKNQVLLQAGTSVLQNANQTSQLVLALLK